MYIHINIYVYRSIKVYTLLRVKHNYTLYTLYTVQCTMCSTAHTMYCIPSALTTCLRSDAPRARERALSDKLSEQMQAL